MNTVVIIGGGYAAWTAAALFARMKVRVTVVAGDDPGLPEACVRPAAGRFLADLGADIPAVSGLGTSFDGWGPGRSYFQPFGPFGDDMDGIGFHHYWLRLLAGGGHPDFGRYSPETLVARETAVRGCEPVDLSTMLKPAAGQVGYYTAQIQHVHRDAETGEVAGLHLADGARIEGQFYIDASSNGRLIGEVTDDAYEDWRRWLPCDRIAAMPGEGSSSVTITTEATGWRWRGPLGQGRAFDSRHAEMAGAFTVRPGHRARFWSGNVVAIGPAAGFIEPLDGAGAELLRVGLARLAEVAPSAGLDAGPHASVINRYNADMRAEWAAWRDFVVARYALAARQDTAFWQDRRKVELPASLSARLDMFARAGHIHVPHTEPFKEADWFALFAGQGFLPRSWHPIADGMTEDELKLRMAQIRTQVLDRVRTMAEVGA